MVSICMLQLPVAASNVRRNHSLWHRWSSGRIRPCHGRDPGSIPGRCSDPITEPSVPTTEPSVHFCPSVSSFSFCFWQRICPRPGFKSLDADSLQCDIFSGYAGRLCFLIWLGLSALNHYPRHRDCQWTTWMSNNLKLTWNQWLRFKSEAMHNDHGTCPGCSWDAQRLVWRSSLATLAAAERRRCSGRPTVRSTISKSDG